MLSSLIEGPMEWHDMIYKDEFADEMQFNRPAELSDYSRAVQPSPLNNQKSAYGFTFIL